MLDSENRDAQRVERELGSSRQPPAREPTNEGTGLVGDGLDGRKKKKYKTPYKTPEKSAKYISEGACTVHGSRCSHSSSECYVLHPELKPKRKGEADLATSCDAHADSKPYGFMNEGVGFCLMMTDAKEESKESDDDDITAFDSAHALASSLPTAKSKKFYTVAVGRTVGVFHEDAEARKSYEGYPGALHKGFKNLKDAYLYVSQHRLPIAVASPSTTAEKPAAKRKPRNYHWSTSGTKASRQIFNVEKNHFNAEVLQFKRQSRKRPSMDNIKQLARTGGQKHMEQPALIDLSLDQEAVPDLPEADMDTSDTTDDEAPTLLIPRMPAPLPRNITHEPSNDRLLSV